VSIFAGSGTGALDEAKTVGPAAHEASPQHHRRHQVSGARVSFLSSQKLTPSYQTLVTFLRSTLVKVRIRLCGELMAMRFVWRMISCKRGHQTTGSAADQQ